MGECCSFKLLGLFTEALSTAKSLIAEPSQNPLSSRGAAEVTLDLLMGCLACLCISDRRCASVEEIK